MILEVVLKASEYIKVLARQLIGNNIKLFGLGAQIMETLGYLCAMIKIGQFHQRSHSTRRHNDSANDRRERCVEKGRNKDQ